MHNRKGGNKCLVRKFGKQQPRINKPRKMTMLGTADPVERLRRVGGQRTVFEVSLHEDLSQCACLDPVVAATSCIVVSEEARHSEKSYNFEPTPAFCQLVPHCLNLSSS